MTRTWFICSWKRGYWLEELPPIGRFGLMLDVHSILASIFLDELKLRTRRATQIGADAATEIKVVNFDPTTVERPVDAKATRNKGVAPELIKTCMSNLLAI